MDYPSWGGWCSQYFLKTFLAVVSSTNKIPLTSILSERTKKVLKLCGWLNVMSGKMFLDFRMKKGVSSIFGSLTLSNKYKQHPYIIFHVLSIVLFTCWLMFLS